MNLNPQSIDMLAQKSNVPASKSDAECFSESNYAMSMLSTKDTFTSKKNPRSFSHKSLISAHSSTLDDQDIVFKTSKFQIKKKKVHFEENKSKLEKIDSN